MKKTITKLIFRACPLLFLEAMMSIVVSLCITGGNSVISKLADDGLQGKPIFYRQIVPLFIGFLAAGTVASFVRRFCAGTFANSVCINYRKMIAQKLYRIEYRFFAQNSTGTLLNKTIGDIHVIEEFLDSTFPEMLGNLIAMIVYAVYIARMNLGLFALICVSYPLIFRSANLFAKKMKKLSSIYREKADVMADIAQSAVSGILVVRAFGLEEVFRNKMKDAADALVENEQRRTSITNTTLVIRQMLQWLPNILCALYAAYLVSKGNLSLGDLLGFVLILSRFVESFIGLPFQFVDAAMGIASIERIENLLAQKNETDGDHTGEERYEGSRIIEFDNVSFGYEKEREKVLDKIDLTVSEHDRIALIGESGGGKSTFVSLLCGLYDDYEGEIRLWGRELREWNKEALRDRISLVSQDVFLFPASIEENVAFGLEGATHEKVVEACREANIHEFIESLPDGYKTVIGERGAKLSGGQKQRLSIARAILKDAEIMIMDEPTSSVDVETENEIQKEIERIGKNKTCITIAHRLNTIKNCHYVYRFEGGKVTERLVNAE